MSFVVRAATARDLPALYEMAKLTGGGFTNLPADRGALAAKLERSAAAFSRSEMTLTDELFVLVLENTVTGEVRGTAQIYTQVGQRSPFYSYKITALSQHSPELSRTVTADILELVTDLGGASEVGGLFLHPSERAGGLGLLLARSRYLFIAMHRARFADRILAELRGIIDERGAAPFWDAIGRHFFGMGFQEADYFNAIHGTQFIADLMPRHPVYVAMLPASARAVIGLPHPSGRAAMRMLEDEGFAHRGFIDIFDGGPAMTARTDEVASIRGAVRSDSVRAGLAEGEAALLSAGQLGDFRCCYGRRELAGGDLAIDDDAAALLSGGGSVWSIAR
ncbi:MAG: arginine N-succinyltransferase [Croceibacterium sp.]